MSLNATGQNFAEKLGLDEGFLKASSKAHKVPAPLILAVIMVESSGITTAMRYEKKYRWVTNVATWAKKMRWTKDTERALQSFSIGLMQIMTATARDHGFSKHPIELTIPKIGVSWGCYHLNYLFRRYGYWPDAISAYNQGNNRKRILNGKKFKNQEYVDKVYRYMEKFGTRSTDA